MRPTRRSLAPLLAAAAAAPRCGQTWTQVTTATNRGRIRDAAMAFHSPTGRTVLFGGQTQPGVANDTWEWDGERAGRTGRLEHVLRRRCRRLRADRRLEPVRLLRPAHVGLRRRRPHVTPDLLSPEFGAGGTTSCSAALPSAPALAGFGLHAQAVAFEAGVNASGAVVSDAATATLGN